MGPKDCLSLRSYYVTFNFLSYKKRLRVGTIKDDYLTIHCIYYEVTEVIYGLEAEIPALYDIAIACPTLYFYLTIKPNFI